MAKPLPTVHTSMRGVQINMAEMRAKNEASVAVTGTGSSLRMNARGDTLAEGGRIDRRREEIEEQYNTQLQGNVKRVDVRTVEADTFETPQQVLERLRSETEAKAEKPTKTNELAADNFAEANTTVEPPKNVVGKDRARKLSEKDD